MALKNPVTEERYAAAQAATRERHVANVKSAVDALVENLGRGETDAWDLVDKLRSEVARSLIDNAKLRHDLSKANTVIAANPIAALTFELNDTRVVLARARQDLAALLPGVSKDVDRRLERIDERLAKTLLATTSQQTSTQPAPTEERKP